MLDDSLLAQLKDYLTKVTTPVSLLSSLDDSAKSVELDQLLALVASLSDMLSYRRVDTASRRPSFRIQNDSSGVSVEFAGIPLGHEFTSFVLALLQVGGHPIKESQTLLFQVANLPGDYHFETFMSLSCVNCPEVVQALNAMAVTNPRVQHTAIDGALFPTEVEDRGILAVPAVFLNGELFASGRMSLADLLTKLDAPTPAGPDRQPNPFDVLVVGGGPAGAAAAVYAARKGIRTGLVADRLGGQVLDTMAIENFISVPHTQGPEFAAALFNHVDQYGVEVIKSQQVVELVPPSGHDLAQVRLATGLILQARSVILAPGASWRTLGVAGEEEYRNKGVTFCPHCDGPLFASQPVAVIGGGNSGVEAAIDLAGLASQVKVVEFDAQLRADAVLLAKLASLPNVKVVTSAQTTRVVGDGRSVTALEYLDRGTGAVHQLPVRGVFVQIGLIPSTSWLEGVVDLSDRAEIVIDERGRTSVPGVFAAGDATTVPFKQIVVAAGSGATAALSAFDFLIRS